MGWGSHPRAGGHQGEDEELERGEVRELQLGRRLVRQHRGQLPLRVQPDLPPHHLPPTRTLGSLAYSAARAGLRDPAHGLLA